MAEEENAFEEEKDLMMARIQELENELFSFDGQ